MSPRDLSPGVVRDRLEEMALLLEDLERRTAVTAEALAEDRDLRHVVEHVLIQLVQQAVALNSHITGSELGKVVPDYQASFRLAAEAGALDSALAEELGRSAGLRNVLVHEYLAVDLVRVAASVPLARELYGQYVQQVAAWLLDRQARSG